MDPARRCLMLHGYLSCAAAFSARTGAIRKALPGIDFIYADAPLALQVSDKELIGACPEYQCNVSVPLEALDARFRPEGALDSTKCRGWFLFEMEQGMTSSHICGSVACCDCLPRKSYGLDEACTFLLNLLRTHTPAFVLAFSQAATLLLYLLLDGRLVDLGLEAIVLVAPWIPHRCTHTPLDVVITNSPKDRLTEVLLEGKKVQTSARVTVLYGEADGVISLEGLKSFRERHPEITYHTHPGGHMVPGSSDVRALLRREFTRMEVL